MSPVSSQILWCLPWKQALVLLSLFLELTAECSPAAIQLQAPSLLRCEQLGPLCASGVRLVLQLSEIAFLTTGYISAFPLKPCSYTGTLSSTQSTSKLCLAVEHHICFPFVVWDVFRTNMITFHLIFKKESKHTQTKKLFWTGWVPSPVPPPPSGWNQNLSFSFEAFGAHTWSAQNELLVEKYHPLARAADVFASASLHRTSVQLHLPSPPLQARQGSSADSRGGGGFPPCLRASTWW